MTINRTSIGSQVKGNKMKRKKPVQKANAGKFLEAFSPAYSVLKGKGPISDALSKVKGVGLLGAAGSIARKQREKNDPKNPIAPSPANPMAANNATPMTPLKSGGMVKKRRDGCAIKGKTKGTIR